VQELYHALVSHDGSVSIRCRDVVYLKVREVRNDILHSPNFEVTSADLTTYLDKMTDLLQEPALQQYASARRAVDEINKVTVLSNSLNIFGSVQQFTFVHTCVCLFVCMFVCILVCLLVALLIGLFVFCLLIYYLFCLLVYLFVFSPI